MLGFGNARAAALSELIAKKRYQKAIEILREDLRRRRRDPRLRRQLADVLVMAGRSNEAVPILLELSEDLALSGEAGKAVAVLKRARKLEPGKPEVEERLAYLIAQEKAPSPDPWARARAGTGAPPPPRYEDAPAPAFPGDLEEISDADATAPPAEPGASTPPPAAGEAGPLQDEAAEGDEDTFRAEILGLIEDVFSGRATPETAAMASVAVVETPLFPDFSVEELVEVIRGLELRAFEPGEIVVTEGEAGESLFLLTTGSVRTYVRDATGRSAAVRILREGDFFGEVSLLEASPRTATVTAASHCEMLEIDRLTLGQIARRHPRVWSVVRGFYEKRSRSEAELAARAGTSEPGDTRGTERS